MRFVGLDTQGIVVALYEGAPPTGSVDLLVVAMPADASDAPLRGRRYDVESGKLIQPQPYPSWQRDANDGWKAPVDPPIGGAYDWDEQSQSWLEVQAPL